MAFELFMKTSVIIRMVFHLFLLFIHNKKVLWFVAVAYLSDFWMILPCVQVLL